MQGYSRAPTRDDADVVGARIGAAIIDSVVGFILYIVLATMFLGGGIAAGEGAAAGGFFISFFILPFAVFIGYYLLLEGLWDGYTVGKKMLGIKVVKEDGSPIGLGDSVLRNVLRFIDGLFYYVVGFIFIATSDRKQRLGDRVASTVVVTDTPAESGAPHQQSHPQGGQQPQHGQPQGSQQHSGQQPQQGQPQSSQQPQQGQPQGSQQQSSQQQQHQGGQ